MMTMKERDLLISVIYERCSCGEISIEERENLIDDVKEKYIRENTIIEDVEIDEDVLDKINMFKEAVYEKYSNGEITLEEREELIDRVQKEFIDVYTESSDVGIFKKKIDEIKRKNSHKRDNFKKKKLNKFNNKMIAETKQIIEKNERNLKGLVFCYPHYEHIIRKDTADAIRNLHNIIEEINPERSVEENKVVVDKYKDTAKGITADFKKYDTGIKGYMIKVNVDEFYKNLTEFAKHMTDDINLLESMDKKVYDTVMARSKKIKDKYIYNALNSMYSDYCQFSTFILSLYTAEITSYYKGISILNKYNKQHREHELTPEAQRIKNIDNNSILNAMMKKGSKNKGGYSLDFNDETSATKDYTSREYNLYKYDGDDDYNESVYDKYYNGEITLEQCTELINQARIDLIDLYSYDDYMQESSNSESIGKVKKTIEEIKMKIQQLLSEVQKKISEYINNKVITKTKMIIDKNKNELKKKPVTILYYKPFIIDKLFNIIKDDLEDICDELYDLTKDEDDFEDDYELMNKQMDGIINEYEQLVLEIEQDINGHIETVWVTELSAYLNRFAGEAKTILNGIRDHDKSIYNKIKKTLNTTDHRSIHYSSTRVYNLYFTISKKITQLIVGQTTSYYKIIKELDKLNSHHREHELSGNEIETAIKNDKYLKTDKMKEKAKSLPNWTATINFDDLNFDDFFGENCDEMYTEGFLKQKIDDLKTIRKNKKEQKENGKIDKEDIDDLLEQISYYIDKLEDYSSEKLDYELTKKIKEYKREYQYLLENYKKQGESFELKKQIYILRNKIGKICIDEEWRKNNREINVRHVN